MGKFDVHRLAAGVCSYASLCVRIFSATTRKCICRLRYRTTQHAVCTFAISLEPHTCPTCKRPTATGRVRTSPHTQHNTHTNEHSSSSVSRTRTHSNHTHIHTLTRLASSTTTASARRRWCPTSARIVRSVRVQQRVGSHRIEQLHAKRVVGKTDLSVQRTFARGDLLHASSTVSTVFNTVRQSLLVNVRGVTVDKHERRARAWLKSTVAQK